MNMVGATSFFHSFSIKSRLILGLIALLVFSAPDLQAATAVKITKQAGVYTMPCTVNGLQLRFIIDTGASDVSISAAEAVFMLKNGYLNESDIVGTENYQLANGSIQQGTVVIFREIVIGESTLRNVRASVSHNIAAPLLLGQSALSRLGVVSFDYTAGTVTFGGISTGNMVGSVASSEPRPRFSRSTDGVITDSQTNLQWLPGPRSLTYEDAKQWITSQTVAGGGWRMPTVAELKTLYGDYDGYDDYEGLVIEPPHISPLFRYAPSSFSRDGVWAEARDSERAWYFNFASQSGSEELGYRKYDRYSMSADLMQVFAVRQRSNSARAPSQPENIDQIRQKAEQGDSEAQFIFGQAYANGRGVVKDDKEAVDWYQKAANQNNDRAQTNLGWMYSQGRGVTRDDSQAAAWYRKAANQNNVIAENNLGFMYQKGRGVTKDDNQALYWYRKAAYRNLALAQLNLGRMYLTGQGIPKNYIEAYAWFIIAATNSNDAKTVVKAVKYKDETKSTLLSADQIAAGEQRANELRQQINRR